MHSFPSSVEPGPRPARAVRRRPGRGFTLIELMVTVAIAGILSALAAPSLTKMFKTNRVQTEAGSFVGDLMLARTEAVKRGQSVSVCTSTDGVNCLATPSVAWQVGWIVFADPTGACAAGSALPAIKVRAAFKGTDTLIAPTAGLDCITFNREGFTTGLGSTTAIFTLHTSDNLTTATRCVSVDLGGRFSTLTSGQTSSSGTGTCS